MARKRHPNYKGGVVDPRGYRLVYVGKNHHLADVRGYAYEHRLAAERKLGRRLKRGEVVHHKKSGRLWRGKNRKSMIEVFPANAAHLNTHRRVGLNRRRWKQTNPTVKCLCGCGQKFPRFDKFKRPRKYRVGHWRRNITNANRS